MIDLATILGYHSIRKLNDSLCIALYQLQRILRVFALDSFLHSRIHYIREMKTFSFYVLVSSLLCVTASANAQDDCMARGVSYARDSGQEWISEQGCVSCHQIPSMTWAHEAAIQSGIDVPTIQFDQWKLWRRMF